MAVSAASGAAPEEVFVARRELDGPLTEEEVLSALRAQAVTWSGSPRTILLGTEVSAVEGDRTSGGRWQVRARFVREPPPRPPEPAVVRAADWLGFTAPLPRSHAPRDV
ncbi:hypothetical protein [Auraticoccus monumenti]|uniref:Uncharacterized protein n=1 Tax=Auraticoccus monumenti TaxID=675864 RepID=A0A1G7AEP3_9ACTN|nr:hypothetical protein [Auraticoccus monumenti]SDE13394.1 hypothetical protein SAMN04489747_2595 [Auraticoccus monumenti]